MRARGHIITGIVAGLAFDAASQAVEIQANPTQKFDWIRLGACGAVAGAAALVPDLLEPAINPHHRKFCHSVVFGGLVVWMCFGAHTQKCGIEVRKLLAAAAVGYASHLVADALTPRSIRFV